MYSQQLQGQVHALQLQQQLAQTQVAEAHRLRLEAYAAADAAIHAADRKLDDLQTSLEKRVCRAQQASLKGRDIAQLLQGSNSQLPLQTQHHSGALLGSACHCEHKGQCHAA